MSEPQIPGTGDEDAALDTLLRDYLSARLDGQLGRAAAHFHRHLSGAGTGTGPGGAAGSPRRSPGSGGWVIGIVGGALAASIAALWAGPSLRTYAPPEAPQHPGPVASDIP